MFMRFLITIILFRISVVLTYSNLTDKDPTNKVVVVTGAAQGIGRAIAENFIKSGAKFVIILDIKVKKGKRTADYLNCKYGKNKAVFIKCDITKDLDKVSNRITKEYGYVDLLINNAGVLNEYCPKKIVETNLIATTMWSLKFFELMRKDKGGKCGTIINVSSTSGYLDIPFIYIYKGTKLGVTAFSKSLGHDYRFRESCVRVLALCPGLTYTAMTRQQMVVDEHLATFNVFKKILPWQTTHSVGLAAVDIYRNAPSGTVWDAQGGEPPKPSPDLKVISIEEIDKLSTKN